MDAEIARALADVLVPVVTSLAVALGGWIASRLPGPLRDVMTANVHRQDVQRLVEMMQRRAMAEVTTHTTPPPTPAEIVAYVERVRGDLLAKMQVKPEALATMAQAAIATANVATALTPALVAAPSDVLVATGDLSGVIHRPGTPGG